MLKMLRLEAGVGGLMCVLGAVAILWSRTFLLQVVAVAAILMGAYLFWQWASGGLERSFTLADRRFDVKTVLKESFGPVAIMAVTIGVYWPLARGYMPWMADHTVHQYKAYVLAEHLIPSGRLMGWSHLSGSGFPAGQLYPILGDLWVTVVRYLTFGQLSWETTYAWALLLVLLFTNLVPYYVGRRLFGPVAGLVAGLLVLTDLGGFREGGWTFTVRYGVWPLALAVSLGLLSLERLRALSTTRDLSGVVSFAAVAALGLLAHPFNLILLAAAVPLFCIYQHLWYRKPFVWLKSLGAMGLGLGLCSFWLVPYLARAGDYSAKVSNLWKSLPAIGTDVLEGGLFEGFWPWALVLGALGAVVVVFERRPFGRFLGALSALLLAGASITVYAGTDVESWLGSIRHVQFQRLVIFVKLIWAVSAGYLVQRVFVGLPSSADGGEARPVVRTPSIPEHPRRRLRHRITQAAGLLVAAPLVSPIVTGFVTQRLIPLTRIETRQSGVPFHDDFVALLEEIETREASSESFFRVAYWTGFNDHSLANGPVLSGLAQVKCSFIPGETFRFLANSSPSEVPRTPKDFEVLNVKYILANRPLPQSLSKESVLIARRGRLSLHELQRYSRARATLLSSKDPAEEKAGKVEVEEVGPETIRLRVSDLSEPTELVVHTAAFANWRASQSGRELQIEPYDGLAPNVDGLMKVTVTNGVVTFAYVQQPIDWVAKLLTLLALAIAVLLALAHREVGWPARAKDRIFSLGRRYEKHVRYAGVGVACVVVLALIAARLRADRLPERGRSLTWELDGASVYVQSHDETRRCRFFIDGRFLCGPKPYQWVGPVAEEWNLKNRRGLWAHPHRDATLVIEFPEVPMGGALSIEWGILESGSGGRAAVHLDVFVNGKRVGQASRRARGWSGPKKIDVSNWQGKEATVRFEIKADDIAARHFVFDARVLP